MTDREFWLVVHRALLAVAGAIEKKYLRPPEPAGR